MIHFRQPYFFTGVPLAAYTDRGAVLREIGK
jgi:hypothetical protein